MNRNIPVLTSANLTYEVLDQNASILAECRPTYKQEHSINMYAKLQIGGMPFRLVLHENNDYTSLFHSINCPFDECVYYHLNDAAWLHFAKIIQVRDDALIPTQDQILWKYFLGRFTLRWNSSPLIG